MKWAIIELIGIGLLSKLLHIPTNELIVLVAVCLVLNWKQIASVESRTAKDTKT